MALSRNIRCGRAHILIPANGESLQCQGDKDMGVTLADSCRNIGAKRAAMSDLPECVCVLGCCLCHLVPPSPNPKKKRGPVSSFARV